VEEGGVVISDFKIENSFNRNFQKGKRIGTQPKLQETGRIGGENTAGEKQVREGGYPFRRPAWLHIPGRGCVV
jgi:hypothetical protein